MKLAILASLLLTATCAQAQPKSCELAWQALTAESMHFLALWDEVAAPPVNPLEVKAMVRIAGQYEDMALHLKTDVYCSAVNVRLRREAADDYVTIAPVSEDREVEVMTAVAIVARLKVR